MEQSDIEAFIDPISYEEIDDPVIAEDNCTYDRKSIELWIKTKKDKGEQLISPYTGAPMGEKLIPNHALRQAKEQLSQTLPKRSSSSGILSSSTASVDGVENHTTGIPTLSSEVYDNLDSLMDTDYMKSIGQFAPQVVVLGSEKHGKSSVLERLTGFPIFPRNPDLCTRCAIRVKLRRGKVKISRVYVKYHNSDSIDQDCDIAIDQISHRIKTLMDEMTKGLTNKRAILDDREIVVEISVPYCGNIDILDLPGLVAAPRESRESAWNIAKNIVETESPHSIFLLVVDSRSSPTLSLATSLIDECKVANKTIGVFTKLDILTGSQKNVTVEDIYKAFLDNTNNKNYPLEKGWMGCANISSIYNNCMRQEGSGSCNKLLLKSLIDMEDKEHDFLTRNFSEPALLKGLGMQNIRNEVRFEFERFLSEDWVDHVKETLTTAFLQCSDRNANLGLPIPRLPQYKDAISCLEEVLPMVYAEYNMKSLFGCIKSTLLGRLLYICQHTQWCNFKDWKCWEVIDEINEAENQHSSIWSDQYDIDNARILKREAEGIIKELLNKLVEFLKEQSSNDLGEYIVKAVLLKEPEVRENMFEDCLDFSLDQFDGDQLPDVTKFERFPILMTSFNDIILSKTHELAERFVTTAQNYIRGISRIVDIDYSNEDSCVRGALSWSHDLKKHVNNILEFWHEEVLNSLPNLVTNWTLPEDCFEESFSGCNRHELLEEMTNIAIALQALKRLQDRVQDLILYRKALNNKHDEGNEEKEELDS